MEAWTGPSFKRSWVPGRMTSWSMFVVTFTPNGKNILFANEGETNDKNSHGRNIVGVIYIGSRGVPLNF